jgi:hypothetical protein
MTQRTMARHWWYPGGVCSGYPRLDFGRVGPRTDEAARWRYWESVDASGPAVISYRAAQRGPSGGWGSRATVARCIVRYCFSGRRQFENIAKSCPPDRATVGDSRWSTLPVFQTELEDWRSICEENVTITAAMYLGIEIVRRPRIRRSWLATVPMVETAGFKLPRFQSEKIFRPLVDHCDDPRTTYAEMGAD